MATFNKTEQAFIDSIIVERHPDFELRFQKSGKVKDSTIRYAYFITVRFSVPWGFGYRGVFASEEVADIEVAVKEAAAQYQKTINSGVHNEKIYTDDCHRCICGSQIYGHGSDLRIYIGGVGEDSKLYTYPNGDVAIFIDDKKCVIANSPLMYQEFKETGVYRETYAPKETSIFSTILVVIVLVVIISLLVMCL